MNILFATTLALSAAFINASGSHSGLRANREMQAAAVFPPYNQQCRDDAGPAFGDDAEIYGPGMKYHQGKPANAIGECPSALAGACAVKPKTEAFLEGPIDCGGKGWFCRILEEPGWPNVALKSDTNFGYCNTTAGFADAANDQAGHCHGSDADETFYWWVRDHWHRQYNGRLRCCCGWDEVTKGTIVDSCDYRRLVTPTENLENCRDANEEGVTPYRGGCDTNPANRPTLNEPLVEDDAMCWEVQKFGKPGDDFVAPAPTMSPVSSPTDMPVSSPTRNPTGNPVTRRPTRRPTTNTRRPTQNPTENDNDDGNGNEDDGESFEDDENNEEDENDDGYYGIGSGSGSGSEEEEDEDN